jgi:hypothetical protein
MGFSPSIGPIYRFSNFYLNSAILIKSAARATHVHALALTRAGRVLDASGGSGATLAHPLASIGCAVLMPLRGGFVHARGFCSRARRLTPFAASTGRKGVRRQSLVEIVLQVGVALDYRFSPFLQLAVGSIEEWSSNLYMQILSQSYSFSHVA